MVAKQLLDSLELCAVAGGNGHRDFDGGRVRVVHGSMQGGAEGGADFQRSEEFECEGDAVRLKKTG